MWYFSARWINYLVEKIDSLWMHFFNLTYFCLFFFIHKGLMLICNSLKHFCYIHLYCVVKEAFTHLKYFSVDKKKIHHCHQNDKKMTNSFIIVSVNEVKILLIKVFLMGSQENLHEHSSGVRREVSHSWERPPVSTTLSTPQQPADTNEVETHLHAWIQIKR